MPHMITSASSARGLVITSLSFGRGLDTGLFLNFCTIIAITTATKTNPEAIPIPTDALLISMIRKSNMCTYMY